MKTYGRHSAPMLLRLILLGVLIAAVVPEVLRAHQTLRKPGRTPANHMLAPDPLFDNEKDISHNLAFNVVDTPWGFVEFFRKLFGSSSENAENEPPKTSEQSRAAWQEEERHSEFAFCTDVGFRGLHPEEGGEETACWSRCGRVCEGSMFLAEDALTEWRLISVATRTKPCKTLAQKSAVQILCKAIKKPTNFDITTAVKQETTFDNEAQQQQQLQLLQQQQMLVQQQHALTGAPAVGGSMLPEYPAESPQVAPNTFAAAAYGRSKSSFPHWAFYLILIGIAFLCAMFFCCRALCKRR